MSREADIAEKTRALKKYEAEATLVAHDSAEPPLDLLSPFGPLIGRSTATPALLSRINAFAETMAKPNEGSEFLVPPTVAADGGEHGLAAFIESQVRRYVRVTEGQEPSHVVIEAIWIISQYAGTPSPVHFHSDDISGVLYLKQPTIAPGASELAKAYISGRQAGYLNFMTGGKQRFARTLMSVPPDVGTFYIFPAWLLHGAEPFKGPGERRSLSFNARVDGPA